MLLGLIFYQFAIRKMNKKFYEKNKQFEFLSDTIDETFLIFEKDEVKCEFVSGSAEKILGIPVEKIRNDRELPFQYMADESVAQIKKELNEGEKTTWETTFLYHLPQYMEDRWIHARFYLVREGST